MMLTEHASERTECLPRIRDRRYWTRAACLYAFYRTVTCLGTIALLLAAMSTCSFAVQYRVTFDATWSSESHPGAYPGGAHFSSLIGGTHDSDVTFWEPGSLATEGLERVAEIGSTTNFAQELDAAIAAGDAFEEQLQARAFDSPGQQSLLFEAIPEFPLVTLVTMVAPSPDWFVGVRSLDLRAGDQWQRELVVEAIPYDAGTEDGSGFSLSNPSTSPPEVITRLDEDESSPFFNSAPLGTFRFELLPACDFNQDGACDVTDLDATSGLYSVGDLGAGVAIQPANSRFDLTGDAVINGSDLDQWLADAAFFNGFAEPYLKGDSNLNDHVGFGDFTALSANFGTGRLWSEGNFDGSGTTSFSDFLHITNNFGRTIAQQEVAFAVPEPSALSLWLLGACFGLYFRRSLVV